MKKKLRVRSCGEFVERSLMLADVERKSLSKKKSWKILLKLCGSKKNVRRQEVVLILGHKVGCNSVRKLVWLDERQNHRMILIGRGLEDHLVQTSLMWVGSPSSRTSCSRPHPTWPWTLPGTGQLQSLCASASPPLQARISSETGIKIWKGKESGGGLEQLTTTCSYPGNALY